MTRAAFAMLFAVCGTCAIVAQEPTPRFEVVSIRPSRPADVPGCQPPSCYTSFYTALPGRFTATKMSVLGLVAYAYEMPSNRMIGPDWAKSELYEVDATHGLPESDRAGLRAMLQGLLQERFSLQLHREQRRMAVYVLTKARSDGRLGPQLVSIADCSDRPPFLPSYYKSCGVMGVRGATTRIGMGRWADLALYRHLEQSLGQIIVDETGLSGWFAALLEWSNSPRSSSETASDPSDRLDLFVALREQLGLELERAERPVDVLVVDRVERPTEN